LPRQRRDRFWRRGRLAAAWLALALGACSGDSGLFPKTDAKFDFGYSPTTLNPLAKNEPKQRAVTPNDLIGANGRCAGEVVPAPTPGAEPAPQALNFTAGPQAGPAVQSGPGQGAPIAPAAPVRGGVALGMTECDVVRALGHTDRIEISANERGQRNVVLTYPQGERPGIYRFLAGQLVSIERTAEPPPAPKAAKPKKSAKKEPPG
jgi:hypothetical protein